MALSGINSQDASRLLMFTIVLSKKLIPLGWFMDKSIMNYKKHMKLSKDRMNIR